MGTVPFTIEEIIREDFGKKMAGAGILRETLDTDQFDHSSDLYRTATGQGDMVMPAGQVDHSFSGQPIGGPGLEALIHQ